ncbi:MAG TPA: transcription termination/antitermination protein NusG [Desulfotomaculum sp.]|nr:transcription termination/antitermination protein NusG [Desulfotomaculum sp.]
MEGQWYVVHTYAGYENKVKANLEKRICSMNMEEKIFEIIIPVEDEIEIKDGRKKINKRKIFPGYVLVNMIMTDDSWYVVRNTPGVTGFVGSGGKPVSLTEEEMQQVMRSTKTEEPKTRIDLPIHTPVRVTSGPFAKFTGTVEEIYPDKNKLKVHISIFGRETPVELDFYQVEKII